ncbi:MAG TPA: TolC family protein, partial [Puia sp.]|nr:TolC family protein [Puia sp.]
MSKIVLVACKRVLSPVVLLWLSISASLLINTAAAQINNTDTAQTYTLDQCVTYAMKHEPMINMAVVSQAIVRANNSIATAGWLPQVNVGGSYTHYFTLPTSPVFDSA